MALNPDGSFRLDHTYLRAGRYTVTLTVVDKDQGAGTFNLPVQVAPPPPVLSGRMGRYSAAFVTWSYRNLLNRPPEHAGLLYWARVLRSGVPSRRVSHSIWKSPESRKLHPKIGWRTAWINAHKAGLEALHSSRASIPAGPRGRFAVRR